MQTAFLMNDGGDMFTTRQIVESCGRDSLLVRMADGSFSRAEVIAISNKYDLAALRTDITQDRFASVRVNHEGFTMVPTPGEDVFAAGFGGIQTDGFKIHIWQGRTVGFVGWQDARSSISAVGFRFGVAGLGAPILDDAAILVGIVFANADAVGDEAKPSQSGGTDGDVVLMHNGNAIVDFANEHRLRINAWSEGVREHALFVLEQLQCITAMVSSI